MVDFLNEAAMFVYYRTYSRWRDDLGRREMWEETVDRVISFLRKHRGELVPNKVFNKIREGMLNFSVLPAMRLVWSAGSAAEADNIAIYNCSFMSVAADCPEAFAECLYILMNGTGVGYSVEKRYIDKMPEVPVYNLATMHREPIVISDDKKGWADSVKSLVMALFEGGDIEFDYSKIRKKGERLKTMGGRASGPEPLATLHNFIRDTFMKAQGRKLKSIEISDIMNAIAESVQVGGVRRSSQISLSDLEDEEMRNAKIWPFPNRRSMSNNSAVYKQKPDAISFLREWTSLAASGTGERGIFNLDAARKTAPSRREKELILGTNPCGEIMLRDKQFCNLSTIIVRPDDDLDSLLEKAETAAWIGTIQASFTHFPYLRKKWTQNCKDEALLGVSISGQMDNQRVLTVEALKAMKARVTKINKRAAKHLGINEAAAITCTKPEGTTSQITFSGSGIHPWYAPHYIRRYRISSTDPLFKMMRDQGFEFKPENKQTEENASTWVIGFPVKAPKTATFRTEMTAMNQLEWYKHIQKNWCEHNASMTVYVKENEWLEIGNWVYNNWECVNGVSFYPHDGAKHEQPPYEEITAEEYERLSKNMPKIDYSQLNKYEMDDLTEGAQNYACVAGSCELK